MGDCHARRVASVQKAQGLSAEKDSGVKIEGRGESAGCISSTIREGGGRHSGAGANAYICLGHTSNCIGLGYRVEVMGAELLCGPHNDHAKGSC